MKPEEVQQLQAHLGPAATCAETHISWVLLTEDWAYKIKKPIAFSFLDFSTLALRRDACQQELLLNRRLAPETYHSIVAIHQRGKDLAFSDDCESPDAIEFAVKMHRLDTEMEMDKLLAKGAITPLLIHTLACKIARFHRQATVIDRPGQSDPDAYQRDFNDILQHAPTFVKALGPTAQWRLEAIVHISNEFLSRPETRKFIRHRGTAGFVRDVHGDLHTRNIFAYPDPVVFDCIEFNDHFRQIDLLNEVAFLCMDLEEQGHYEWAKRFFESYAHAIPEAIEPGAEQLFLWFKAYRANIRAKVNAIKAASTDTGAAPHFSAESIQEMEAYLTLIERYLKDR